jgi:putative tricarboxylic transport membrane protein
VGAFNNLMDGFLLAGTPEGLLYCLIGVTIGTMVGVLPGLGPVGAMALLFPISLKVGPMYGIIMLTGIYFGAMYGGSTTSILINVPGEACSVVTCIDGNQMAKKGRAGAALAVCAIGSWVAGTAGIVLITLFAPPLARIALTLGPQEFFSIMLFGLIVLSSATGGSPLKSLLAVLLGMMFGTVGLDVLTGANRFTFGFFQLSKGIQTVSLVMGLFGFSEVLSALIKPYDIKDAIKVRFKDLYPKKEELKRSVMPIIRGTLCGLPIGLLPGSSTLVATLLSYRTEKFFAKDPSRFGKGAIEGVAGPESANNAAATAGMIPLLALGLPFSPITAILMGAFMVHGVIPGPFLITQHSGLFWAVVASFYIGNVMLLILNFPLVGIFASLTKVRCSILMPIVAGMVIIGVYALDSNSFDLWIALIFGILAYIMKELVDFPLVPIIIGYILGPMVEKSFRQAMVLSEGSLFAIMQRPISAVFLSAAFLILVIGLVRYFLRITKGNAMVSENSEL